MERISTATAYSAIVANMMASETQESTINAQVSSGETASDLQGYAANAETLMAMQTVNSQVGSYLNTGQVLTAKLSSQNGALTQVAEASATSAGAAITNAIAAGNGDTVMQALQSAFNDTGRPTRWAEHHLQRRICVRRRPGDHTASQQGHLARPT